MVEGRAVILGGSPVSLPRVVEAMEVGCHLHLELGDHWPTGKEKVEKSQVWSHAGGQWREA